MKTRTRIGVSLVFPLRDQDRLMVHLTGWDWPFAEFGPVDLHVGDQRIHMRHEGSGNIHNAPVVRLAPCDPHYQSVDEIMKVISSHDLSQVSLEFTPSRQRDKVRKRA
jgi:hypothetical protein